MFTPVPNPTTNPVAAKFGQQDLIRRSASSVTPPAKRQTEVAKLIDVSKCIGCKACQVACLEWNNLTEEVGVNVGVYDNPHDLTANTWTLMRYTEYENAESGNLEWLIRKDGCMHCEDPGCLKACPAPGAIVQYSNGIVDFDHDKCIGCGYCIKGCPFNIPRISQVDQKAYKCSLCSDRLAVGQGPACAKACPTQAIVFGTKDEMKQWADHRIKDLKSRGFKNAGLYDPPGWAVRTSCTCCSMRTSRRSTRDCPTTRRSVRWSKCGRASPSMSAWPRSAPLRRSGSCIMPLPVRTG